MWFEEHRKGGGSLQSVDHTRSGRDCEGKDRLKGRVGVNKVGFLQEFKTYEYILSMIAKISSPLVFYSSESKYIEIKVVK